MLKSAFNFVCLVALIGFICGISCGNNNDTVLGSQVTGSVAPQILYKSAAQKLSIPLYVQTVRVTLSNTRGYTHRVAVPYADRRLNIDNVPIGVVSVQVSGLDKDSSEIYAGSTVLEVRANQIETPTIQIEQQAPLLVALQQPSPSNTTVLNDTLTLKGTFASLSNESFVVVRVNNQRALRINSSWEYPVTLPDGTTTFTITATDSVNNISASQNVQLTYLDSTAPTLSILTPDNSISTVDSILVRVRVQDKSGISSLTIAGQQVVADGQGEASRWVKLATATTKVIVAAIDGASAHNSTNDSISILYNPGVVDHDGPIVTIEAPSTDTTLSLPATVLVQGTAIDDGSGVVSVVVDSVTQATYNASTGNWYTTLSFSQPGTDTVRITATDTKNNSTTVSRVFNVQQSEAPVISRRLSELKLNGHTLAPVFDSLNYNYSVEVPSWTQSVSLIATACDPQAILNLNGSALQSGIAREGITLDQSPTVLNIHVNSAQNSESLHYTITITRLPPIALTLKNLTLSAGLLKPDFDKNRTIYTVALAYQDSSINLDATTESAQVSFALMHKNKSVSNPIKPGVGTDTVLINLSNQLGETGTYRVVFTRSAKPIPRLDTLWVEGFPLLPAFSATEDHYVVEVPFITQSVNIHASADEPLRVELYHGDNQLTTSMAVVDSIDSVAIHLIDAQDSVFKAAVLVVKRAAPGAPIGEPITPLTLDEDDAPLTFTIKSTPEGAKAVRFAIQNQPKYGTITPLSGTLSDGMATASYQPTQDSCGSDGFSLILYDATNKPSNPVQVAVSVVCKPDRPQFSAQTFPANEKQNFSASLVADDADRDVLSWTATNLPAWLQLSNQGVLSGIIPDLPADSVISFVATVTDNKTYPVSQTISLSVQAANASPAITSTIANRSFAEGGTISFNLGGLASDADNEASSLSWVADENSFVTTAINNAIPTKPLTITPKDPDWNGTTSVTLHVSDPLGAQDEQSFSIVVTAVNDAPTITAITPTPSQSISAGSPLNLSFQIQDADGLTDIEQVSIRLNDSLLVTHLAQNIINNTITYSIPIAPFTDSTVFTLTVRDKQHIVTVRAPITVVGSRYSDSLVIMELYQLSGRSFYGWNSSIAVMENNRVAKIDTRNDALFFLVDSKNVIFPPSFYKLTALRNIYIGPSQFEMVFPQSFGRLPVLDSMSIRTEYISLPENFIARISPITTLRFLDLHYSPVTLTEEIGNLVNLEYLDLYACAVTSSIPQSFTNLKKLTYLDLKCNSIYPDLINPSVSAFITEIKGGDALWISEDEQVCW